MADQNAGELVQLFVYDLSQGLARELSPMLLGRQIDGIWHTAIVVGAVEYYYGGGINASVPGGTPFGQPLQKIDLGLTHVPEDVREMMLADLAQTFTPEAYSLLSHNCNNFSDAFANLLVGRGIPAHITSLPADVMATPFGQMLAPTRGMEAQLGNVRQGPAAHFRPQQPATAPAAAARPASIPGGASATASAAASTAAGASVTESLASAVEATAALQLEDTAGGAAASPAVASHAARQASTADAAMQRVHAAAEQAKHAAGASQASPTQPLQRKVLDRAEFEVALRLEFTKLVAAGLVPNEAAAQALQRVKAQSGVVQA